MYRYEIYLMERNAKSTCLGLLMWEFKLANRKFPEMVNPSAVVNLHTFLKDVVLEKRAMETFDGLLDRSLYDTYGIRLVKERESQMMWKIRKRSAKITEFLQNGPTVYFTDHWEETPLKWIVPGVFPERVTLGDFLEIRQKDDKWYKPIKGIGPRKAQGIINIVDEHLSEIGHLEKGGNKNE